MRSGGLTEEIWEWLIDQFSSGDCCPEDSSLVWDWLLSLIIVIVTGIHYYLESRNDHGHY